MAATRTLPALLALPLLLGAALAPVLTMDGFGPIRIGMTRAQVEAASGPVRPDAVFAPDSEGGAQCWEGTMSGPDGMAVVFIDGRLARITVTTPAYATRSGVRVGMAEAQARATYGDRLAAAAHWDNDGHVLTWLAGDGRRGLVLETHLDKVVAISVGESRAIQLREGCI
jgi:hypothetical protein